MRASDAERERVVEALRGHAGEGRLDLAELEDRTTAALGARTREELDGLTADLPRRARRAQRKEAPEIRAYIAVMALLVAIWALTGAGYFWPVWPMLGWGIPLVLCHGGSALGSRRRELARVHPGAP